jgi:hypothetical protein
MRSRAAAILIEDSTTRRSTAIGWRSASSFTVWSCTGSIEGVDAGIVGDHLLGGRGVAVAHGGESLGELAFGQPAHLVDRGVEPFQLFVRSA